MAETVRKCEFVDVDGHWAYTDIVYLYESGILDGVSDIAFEPERYVTRAEFVKMISEIVELPACDDNKFDDISEQLWYFDVVNRASNVGIVKGEGEFFYPERNITREEMAVIIDRCIEYASPGILSGDGEVYEFKDDYAFSAWSVPSIDKLSGLGIINGIYGEFRPCDYATRAQAAVVIKRTINYV